MFVLLFFLASTSASEPVGCRKKISFGLFQPEAPMVKGTCEEAGLGWKGRDTDFIEDKDQFFTKWTDFFLRPECVDKIFVYVSDTEGRSEQLVETREHFPKISATGQNPSNTILIANQREEEICKLRGFKSRLVFVPRFFNKGNLSCYEVPQTIVLNATQPLSSHFLNEKGPVIETDEDNSGAKIFWRREMMETCVQAVEWTLDENTTRIERNESKSKDEDSIFIEGKCEAQEVTLTYIFNEDSSFQINDPSLSLTIPGLCQANWNAVNDQHKKTIGWIVAAATSFALLALLVAICLFVRHKRRNVEKTDANELYNTYYEGGVEYSTVEVSSCKSMFSH